MSKDRLKDFMQKKQTIKKQGAALSKVIELKQKNIKEEFKTIIDLKNCENKYSFLNSMMDDISADDIIKMDNEDYQTITNPIMSTVISGESIIDFVSEAMETAALAERHQDFCGSMLITCSSGTSGYISVSDAKPQFFPNKNQIINDYKVKDDLYDEIDFIKGYLRSNLPGIEDDFDSFINKYPTPEGPVLS